MADILETIRKLLRLSENNSNIHEAAIAAARAHELARKYNIAIELLKEKGEYYQSDPIIDYISEYKTSFFKKDVEKWEMLLCMVVAENNGCRISTVNVTDGRTTHDNLLNIAGREGDIYVVESLVSWLHGQITMLIFRDGHGKSPAWQDAYLLGAVTQVKKRLLEASERTNHEMREKVAGAKDAIARLDNRLTEVDQFLKNRTLTERKKERAEDIGAFAKGFNAAKSIDLNETKKIKNEISKKLKE